ncbi:MAG: hypothetical protein GXY01_00540 [Clostridiales bacterium]|nr:hypothetical protein [Clostridiales bacterium]
MLKWFLEKFDQYRGWKRFLFILGVTLGVLTGIAFFGIFFDLLFRFISVKFDVIFWGIIVVVCIKAWLDKRKSTREPEPAVSTAPDTSTLENDYSVIRSCLFDILPGVCDPLNIVKPVRLEDLNSPSPHIQRGNCVLYEFLVLKKGAVDTAVCKSVIQTKVTQYLQAGLFSGVTQAVFISKAGRSYPILCIDSVKDVGGHVSILATFCNEQYATQLRNMAQMAQETAKPIHRSYADRDF